ncbi:uncharacterized protein EDB91DRAFT_1339508 [Suillus paluster]|uniref:uncharacterized protein n=1 Tax=Suillus paluster TaxID=48578 RepID=UPI001B86E542|nr:uncharacterized protein EDB91DRAFT_1339508 [Suillus paluster]KAG1727193.1 hypothetical protein EDB91DRAFT_1339508 [Suillus paluster]
MYILIFDQNQQGLLHSEIPGQRHRALNYERTNRPRGQAAYSASSRTHAESSSPSPLHDFRAFFSGIRPSSDNKQKERQQIIADTNLCADAERPPSTRFHGVTTFSNLIRSSSDKKGKQKERQPKRHTPQVVRVPLGQATYGDAVGVDDGTRPYVLFFCLSWFQKKEKKPDPPRPVYDDELEDDEPEENILNTPIPTTTRAQCARHDEIELKPTTNQSQPETGPSRLAFFDDLSLRNIPSNTTVPAMVRPVDEQMTDRY